MSEFIDIKKQREQELRTLTAQQLHLRLIEDVEMTQYLEDRLLYARKAEAQTQAILSQLILKNGGAVVYFPAIGEGVLLSVFKSRGFESQSVVLNPKFAEEENAPAPGENKTQRSSQKISIGEADRRRWKQGASSDHE